MARNLDALRHLSQQRQSLQPYESDFLRNLANTRSFSQNSRWKRHASLDAGVSAFRSRMNSLAYDPDSPISYYDSLDEEKRLLVDFPSARFGSFIMPTSPRGFATLKRRRGFWTIVAVCTSVLVTVGLLLGVRRPTNGEMAHISNVLEGYGLPPIVSPSKCENPYMEYGHMTVNQDLPEANRWLPYDPTCVPPELMATLRKSNPLPNNTAPTFPLPRKQARLDEHPLSWLFGKTVLLMGDHVERLHNKDFCGFSGGSFVTIDSNHPLSPPAFKNGIDEKLTGANRLNYDGSRPSICYVDEYDFTIVTVFHYGLANRVEFEHESLYQDPHFYPPVAVEDRISHIVLPLMASIGRPTPDLIEFSSGFWDLRHFTALDELVGADPFAELSTERLQWYSDRLTKALTDIGSVFPGVTLLWRSLHHTPKVNNTPFSRVSALDQLSRKVISVLNRSRKEGNSHLALPPLVTQEDHERGRGVRPLTDRESTRANFLNRVKERIGGPAERVKDFSLEDDVSIPGIIRVDEWGALMLGQEHLMNGMHTPPLPGGYVWSDILLYELERLQKKATETRWAKDHE